MRLARSGLLLVGLVALFVLTRGGRAERPAARLSHEVALRTDPVARPAQPDFLGAGSCSAIACHGSVTPGDRSLSTVLGNEHTTWLSNDSHARAYDVLYQARSERIARNLAADPARPTPAYEDVRCLACHTTPRPSLEVQAASRINSDGVGCESCHGASSRWLGPHTTRDWPNLSPSEKLGFGMRDTKDVLSRARLCAGCHVGDSGSSDLAARDVNHDLIAAGHPRLEFELAAFLDNMPAHWVEKGINQAPAAPGVATSRRAADFPARAWSIGRLVTAEFTVDLLHSRATKACSEQPAESAPSALPVPPSSPWPEFSEYNCFSCHHDLRDQPWRRTSRGEGVIPGAPRWGSWTLPGIAQLIEELSPGPDAITTARLLSDLTAMMEQPAQVASIAPKARQAADAIRKHLELLGTRRLDAPQIERLITEIEGPGGSQTITSWDQATQRYLALVALDQSRAELDPTRQAASASLKTRLRQLRDALRFPPGFDSPKNFNPNSLDAQKPR